MHRLDDSKHEYFDVPCFYIRHGGGIFTLALFGVQRLLRKLKLDGFPEVEAFEWQAECFDESGCSLGTRQYRTSCTEELLFDSRTFFAAPEAAAVQLISGSVHVSMSAVILQSPPDHRPPANRFALDGVFLVCRPGSFITGVHMYHSVSTRSRKFRVKHYAKAALKAGLREARRHFRRPDQAQWRGDAVGAVAVHSSAAQGGHGIAILHNDSGYPGLTAQMEFRDESGHVTTQTIPRLPGRATYKATFAPRYAGGEAQSGWSQALCVEPPLNMGRFLAGEEFPDGSITLDHAYYQQPAGSKWGKEQEARFFRRSLLGGQILGPTNPWLCVHEENVESLISISNQFHPEHEYRYDLLVFAEDGKLVLRKPDFCVLPPWGFAVPSVSAALRGAGIERFQGTYVLAYGAANKRAELPSRIHVQGIYRFKSGYWSGVQSDASIWSSPGSPVAEIEALSPAKVRRRQLWYAPVVESEHIETRLSLANLSYSLDYDLAQTLFLRYFRGGNLLAEKEYTLPAFGSAVLPVRELFSECMTDLKQRGEEYGEVLIYPKTGKTYCASALFVDRKSGQFFLEHVIPLPKFPDER